jgi:hypothetical protein
LPPFQKKKFISRSHDSNSSAADRPHQLPVTVAGATASRCQLTVAVTGAPLANWNAVLRRSVVVAGPESERARPDLGKSLFSASTSFFLLLGEGGRRSIVSHPLTWASRDMLSDPDV